MLYDKVINANIVLFSSNKTIFDTPSVYNKDVSLQDNQYMSFLDEGDIVTLYQKKEFVASTKLLDIQKYIHNTLQVPYKNILDIEIYYTNTIHNSNDSIHSSRYPNENRNSIDFMSSISETCIECKIPENVDTVQMYICIIISEDSRQISDIINRFLFLESYSYDRHIQISNQLYQDRMIETRNSLFDTIYQTFTPYEVSPSQSHSQSSSHSHSQSNPEPYLQVSPEVSILYGYESYNTMEQKYNHSDNNPYDNIISNVVSSFSPSGVSRPRFSTNNVFQNLVQLMAHVQEDSLEEFMEPVKVTIQEDMLHTFLHTYICKDRPSSIIIDEKDTCTICLCEYEKEDEISTIKTCKHFFHTQCIKKWLVECNHKCPVCRKSSDPEKN